MTYKSYTPWSDLVAKLLRGEDDELNEKELYSYVENITHGDKKELQQALKEIEKVMDEEYVFSVYEATCSKYKRGMIKQQCLRDLDDLYFEEKALTKEGKNILSINFLYHAIIREANICEAHREVVERAYEEEDINYLFVQWQELVAEPQIKRLQEVIHDMLGTISEETNNQPQRPNRPEKQLKDYPEVFGIDMCCEITGYKKNTIYKLTAKNEIPFFRPGNNRRKLVFRREELLQWMTTQQQETTQEFINSMDELLIARK